MTYGVDRFSTPSLKIQWRNSEEGLWLCSNGGKGGTECEREEGRFKNVNGEF